MSVGISRQIPNPEVVGLSRDLRKWFVTHREEALDLLAELVRARSLAGEERVAQEIVAAYLEELGLEVDVWEPDHEELSRSSYYCSTREDFAGSPNVVAVWKGAGGGRSLILNGHVDVVPVGDESDWELDPWSGEIHNGRLYGRGATDMKGGSVAAFLAVAGLRSLGVDIAGDVIFESVIEEEAGGAGTLAAILRGYKADGALVPEPTGMRVFPKQQGSMWFRITVNGRAAHGGTRYEGVSAIEKSQVVLDALSRLEDRRNSRISDPLYAGIPIPVPINIGVIKGGEWPSSVPDEVKMEGRMGLVPNESVEEAQREMGEALAALSEEDHWFDGNPPVLEWFGARWLPGDLDPEHDLVKTLTDSFRTALHKDPEMVASPWGTDAGLLAAAADTPAVVFGPGVTAKAHQPDEYIEVDDIFDTALVLAIVIVEWCGRASVA